MEKTKYRASKSRSQGRSAWTLMFRHPVARDDDGRPGLKIRRGLGTSDPAIADALVKEMDILLGDEAYWNIAERSRAEGRFDNLVVRAFYEPMESPDAVDLAAVRQKAIPLPSRDDGYSRVLFMGTTGAGKTSLLRQLIGSHPEKDRFPSTSTGKTTIADIEVITQPGDFDGVVTFFPRRLIQTYVAESVLEACRTAWRNEPDEQLIRDLLNHKDQRFRLSYLLGSWDSGAEHANDDEWNEGSEDGTQYDDTDEPVIHAAEDRAIIQEKLKRYVENVRQLVRSAEVQLSKELGEELRKFRGDDQEAAVQLLIERIEKQRAFSDLTGEILEQILQRFDDLAAGNLTRRGGWPEKWTFRSTDRDTFVRQIRWFSSNNHREYGRLLTPVVQGIRIRGPFKPAFMDNVQRLVLIDGEGLGHTPESAANISTRYTSQYPAVDVILLVDNAEQPMQAAPLTVLRTVATSGHQEKLAIAFTHYDRVMGHNLPNFAEKRAHVLASVKGALSNLKDTIGEVAVSCLENQLDKRCFMFGWLDRSEGNIPQGAKKQLQALMDFAITASEPKKRAKAKPQYDPAGIVLAVQSAADDFHTLWNARLGYGHREGVSKEHWARVKALTRRVALRMNNYEYQHLMPVAELISALSIAISRFLDTPEKWDLQTDNDDVRAEAIAQIRAELHAALHQFAMERLIEKHPDKWSRAFDYRGVGSSYDRARELRSIYDEAAPIPKIELSGEASAFLGALRKLVFQAIKDGGGNPNSPENE